MDNINDNNPFADVDEELAELLAAETGGVDTTPVIDTTNHPGPGCPPWCVMGVDQACVSEYREAPAQYAEAAKEAGYYAYARRRRQPSGILAVEVVIHENKEGGRTINLVFEEGSDEFAALLGEAQD